jgi:hypothetical protein
MNFYLQMMNYIIFHSFTTEGYLNIISKRLMNISNMLLYLNVYDIYIKKHRYSHRLNLEEPYNIKNDLNFLYRSKKINKLQSKFA